MPLASDRPTYQLLYDRIAADPARRRLFEAMLAEDNHGDLQRYCFGMDRFFRGVDLRGKRILEIGSGRGLTSIFMGLQGAARIVSMEPGLAGSRPGVLGLQHRRVAATGLDGIVELLDADFNLWDPRDNRFDVIISEASINHLYESPYPALRHPETYARYREIWRKVHSMLDPGGVCCVSDACRYGFFSMTKKMGIRRPWNPKRYSINWRIHQNPGVWRTILLAAGFSAADIEYPLPYRLRQFGRLVANPVSNFFLEASFSLRAFV